MAKLIVVGDLHFRHEEPWYSASEAFAQWFISNEEWNNPDNFFLQLGDVLNNPVARGRVHYLMVDLFFNKMRTQKNFVIQGNHDHKKMYGSGLEPLRAEWNTRVITFPETIKIGNFEFLALPYYWNYTNDFPPMEEHYPLLDYRGPFVFHHLADETQELFGNHIDLSHLGGRKIGGHIHTHTDRYLGSPYIIRYDERGKQNYIMTVDLDTQEVEYHDVPRFLDYYEMNYGDPIPEVEAQFPIFDILNAPDTKSAEQMYQKDIPLRKITKEATDKGKKFKARTEVFTLEDNLEGFFTLNEIDDPKLKDKVMGVVLRRD